MGKCERQLRRVIRLTPTDERARYAEEWEHDISHESIVNSNSRQVLRGATKVALRRRARWVGHVLLGGRGAAPAVLSWFTLMALTGLAFLCGGGLGVALLAALALLVIGLTHAGKQSLVTYWLIAGSTLVGLCAFAYVWWALGVQIDAADSFTSPPAAASHGGTGLIIMAMSAVVLLVATLRSYAQRRN